VRLAPCPTLVFRAGSGVWPPRRILVPTGGSPWARRAAELAFTLAGDQGEVVILHVIDSTTSTRIGTGATSSPAARMGIGQELVEDLRQLGEAVGARVFSEVRMAGDTIGTVLERAGSGDIDLMVLGTAAHAGSHRLYMGPKVESLLRDPPCPVIVFNV
jgi:K+:H+ antiporter